MTRKNTQNTNQDIFNTNLQPQLVKNQDRAKDLLYTLLIKCANFNRKAQEESINYKLPELT